VVALVLLCAAVLAPMVIVALWLSYRLGNGLAALGALVERAATAKLNGTKIARDSMIEESRRIAPLNDRGV
jgi:hypothetical protein